MNSDKNTWAELAGELIHALLDDMLRLDEAEAEADGDERLKAVRSYRKRIGQLRKREAKLLEFYREAVRNPAMTKKEAMSILAW